MSGERVGWIDASGGVSGDMLLGACLGAGVPLSVIQDSIDQLGLPERIVLTQESVLRGELGATRALLAVEQSHERRVLADVVGLLSGATPEVRVQAAAVFQALAEAESRVHEIPVQEVHFHEVGALDSIADVVGVVTGLQALKLDRLVCSAVGLGGGRVRTEHGFIPVPGPAVIQLLCTSDLPGFGGPVDIELATPTGVALMSVLADEFGPLPPMRPELVGVGAGTKDPPGHANITRLIVGELSHPDPQPRADHDLETEPATVFEANIDDLDPRLWPQILMELLEAGASDAWLTPILMKKGRPAHTLSVLCPPAVSPRLERIVFVHTTTIGLRRYSVDKSVLPRETVVVDFHGEDIRVKLARLDGLVINASPEYEDIARIASDRGIPVKSVMDLVRANLADHAGIFQAE